MSYHIITMLRIAYVKLASIEQKQYHRDISSEQARNLADMVFHDTAAEISIRIRENFVTDN